MSKLTFKYLTTLIKSNSNFLGFKFIKIIVQNCTNLKKKYIPFVSIIMVRKIVILHTKIVIIIYIYIYIY